MKPKKVIFRFDEDSFKATTSKDCITITVGGKTLFVPREPKGAREVICKGAAE